MYTPTDNLDKFEDFSSLTMKAIDCKLFLKDDRERLFDGAGVWKVDYIRDDNRDDLSDFYSSIVIKENPERLSFGAGCMIIIRDYREVWGWAIFTSARKTVHNTYTKIVSVKPVQYSRSQMWEVNKLIVFIFFFRLMINWTTANEARSTQNLSALWSKSPKAWFSDVLKR